MNLLILGRGKTGALVAQVARERGHSVTVAGAAENAAGAMVTPHALAPFHAVIEFTTPRAVVPNLEACIRAGKPIVVGTTGWYAEIPRLKAAVQAANAAGTPAAVVFGANFSIGVNLFFEIARAAAAAFPLGYTGDITERHHIHKKDAPSGTAIALQKVVEEAAAALAPRPLDASDSAAALAPDISSFREGDVVGYHELRLDSPADTITLAHNAKSRRGFAEGALRAAEWLAAKPGFYDFKDVWREV